MIRNAIYLIFSIWLSAAQAQQLGDQAYLFALSQFKNGNFPEAAKEFNRAVFLGSNNNADAFWHIAKCYKQMGEHSLSDSFFDKAYFALKNDSLKNEVLLEKSFANILQKKFSGAYYELVNIDTLYGPVQTETFWLYLGVVYYGMNDFENARLSFMQNFDSAQVAELDKTFEYLNKMQKRHRPGRVETMSYMLPGLGQVHTGNVRAGVNSFALMSALFYAMVRVGIVYSPFDGLFIFAPWLQRYYLGGAEKAKHMAEHKLLDIKNDVFNKLLEQQSK